MILPSRALAFASLAGQPDVDVLVVGGGINGAGMLRELALNGVRALLVDREDFAAGATSASSRMIHGGLRYLENGELRLVRESLRERDRLLRLAAHAVRPLPTTIPIFSRWSGFGNALTRILGGRGRPAARGAALVKIGLTLYDVLTARRRVLPTHHFTSRKVALQERPELHPGIVCTATYQDAQVALPERLCLELIADGCALPAGALAINYCGVVRSEGNAVFLRDEPGGRELAVWPRVVVNATGGWIDFANAALGERTRWIGGTKGSHLVIDHAGLFAACRNEQLYYENSDGRICIFFPVNGRVLVGSTDIRVENPDDAICDEKEVDYLLESVRTVFPAIHLEREHVISHFCGVRPLPVGEDGFTGRISRDHSCRTLPPAPGRPWPVHAMIGGKWTTFRAFSEQVTDRVLADLGRSRIASSAELPIGGEPTPDAHDEAALRRIVRDESVVHLEDLLLRRTALGLYERLSSARISTLAVLCAEVLGWDADRLAREEDRTRCLLAERHGVRLEPLSSHVQRP